ncbi:MAG TPA: hypothetical protein VJP59_01040, partial [Gemmatimonadota bacterium]|nr:hypothetical protein [Gemmatimonadota bacterium]
MIRPVRMHSVTLRFDDPALEARFREQYRASATRQVRVTLLTGSALFLAFIFVDRWADPELALRAWPVRVGVAAVFLAALGLTFAPFWPRIRGRVLWVTALVGGIGLCVLIAIGGPWVELRWVGLVLVVLGADTLLRLAFPAQLLLSAAFFAAWPITLSLAGDFTLDRAIGGWIALGSAYVIGLLAGYTIERYARRGFLHER